MHGLPKRLQSFDGFRVRESWIVKQAPINRAVEPPPVIVEVLCRLKKRRALVVRNATQLVGPEPDLLSVIEYKSLGIENEAEAAKGMARRLNLLSRKGLNRLFFFFAFVAEAARVSTGSMKQRNACST